MSKSIHAPIASEPDSTNSRLRVRIDGRWLLVILFVPVAAYAVDSAKDLWNRQPAVFAVDGMLIVDDKSAGNASLALHRLDEHGGAIVTPVARSRPDGSFRLTTYQSGDGAPPGEYVVTVIWPDPDLPIDECACEDPTEHDLLCGRYADPSTSPLRATIARCPNRIVVSATPCDERTRFERWLRRQPGAIALPTE